MKLLSFIKSAFAKMNEMLNKAWKWVGDFLVDTMTGEIIETSCGLQMPTHKYTWKERIFFAAKATIFGEGSVVKNIKLRDSWLKSLVAMGVLWTAYSLLITFIAVPSANWLFATSFTVGAYMLVATALEFVLRVAVRTTPASYYEEYYEYKADIAAIKAAKASV